MQGRYEFLAQDRIIYGFPAAQAVAETADVQGAQRVFVVTSQTLSRKTDEIRKIREVLGPRLVGLFDECIAHVPRESVLRAADAVRRAEPDLIVTVGGGTPIDTVKILLICLAEGVQTEDELGEFRIRVREDGSRFVPKVGRPPVRQIVLPTTLSGAEFSAIGGATDTRRMVKDLYAGREIGAQVVILDPALTVHTPEWLWLSTGVRAVDHAVESICSRTAQPFTDATCLHGLAMLARSLRRTKSDPQDLDARLESQVGVWLAAAGLGRVDLGASHGIGHELGAVAGVPHGHTSCVLLHQVLRYNREINAARQQLVSNALGDPAAPAGDLIESLVRALGMPLTLRDVGVRRDQFDAVASASMENVFVRGNPRPIRSPQDIIDILNMAW